MLNRLHFKWKIFACLLGFCSLLLVVLWLFQTILLSDMYKIIRKEEISDAITLVQQNIDSNNLYTIIEGLSQDKEIFVTPATEFKMPIKSIEDIKKRPRQESITQTKTFDLKNGTELSLTFHAMITPVNATVSTLRMQLYIIIAIMLILSVLLALFISGWVSKPISQINNSAKLLAKGIYDTHFEGKGFLEITELSDTLNKTAIELSKVESLRRELMSNISHDLRTPLSLIYSYAEMMDDFPQEITTEQTQTIMYETKRLSSLVNDVLDISRFENGNMTLEPINYNFTKNIAETVKRIQELVKKDGYSVYFDYEEEVQINADEVKITQAFYNLLINAINYSTDIKEIVVRQIINDKIVTIEVIDRGCGISPEEIPYIWDRYYKATGNHKRAISGTGLGLSIVRKIIDLHKGDYGVKSETQRGSTFWFSLKR